MESKKDIWTIGAILNWTKQYFSEKGVDNPRLDAEVLLSHVLGRDRLYLYVHFDQPLEQSELLVFRQAVKRRAMRVPVAYITGNREFMGLDFEVDPAVLIPRPDTEILVEAALARLEQRPNPQVLDVGTGSGAIIVSVLAKLSTATGTAVDMSPQALVIARKNAEKHRVAERLELLQGDLFAPVQGRTFSAILSNPPYIPSCDISGLSPEVQQEPHLALAGGNDGLDFYRLIIKQAPFYLAEDGFIAVEVGVEQARLVAYLAEQTGILKVDEIVKDYAGIERVVILKR